MQYKGAYSCINFPKFWKMFFLANLSNGEYTYNITSSNNLHVLKSRKYRGNRTSYTDSLGTRLGKLKRLGGVF